MEHVSVWGDPQEINKVEMLRKLLECFLKCLNGEMAFILSLPFIKKQVYSLCTKMNHIYITHLMQTSGSYCISVIFFKPRSAV